MIFEDILFYNFNNEERQVLLKFLEMANEEYGHLTIEDLYKFVKKYVKTY